MLENARQFALSGENCEGSGAKR